MSRPVAPWHLGIVATTLVAAGPAAAQTVPLPGAVPLPASVDFRAPFTAGERVRILSGYSPTGGSSLHDGTDRTSYANDYYALDLVYADRPDSGLGRDVLAPLDGVVVKAGWASAGWANYGQRVILRHDLGDGHVYHTLYAHLSRIDVSEGARVGRGETIGALGRSCQGALSCSSFSTPHLHFAMHRDSTIGGSGTGGSYGGHAVVPEAFDGAEGLAQGDVLTSSNATGPTCGDSSCDAGEDWASCPADCAAPRVEGTEVVARVQTVLAQGADGGPRFEGDAGAPGPSTPGPRSGALVGNGCSVSGRGPGERTPTWLLVLVSVVFGARRRRRAASGGWAPARDAG